MKVRNIVIVLAISVAKISAALGSDYSKHCRDYTNDLCLPDGEEIAGTTGVSLGFCQFLCSAILKCNYFVYNRPQTVCQIYQGKTHMLCNQLGGPPSPTMTQCESQDLQCHAFIESECNYKGDFLNGYPDIASADMCQEICARSAHCDYFLYNQVNKNCDMLDSRVRECRILMGPPQPSWQVCQPEGNISTSTPFPPTQTTSKPSTATTQSSASSISTQPASFTTTSHPAIECTREGQLLPDQGDPRDCSIYYSCRRSAQAWQWNVTKCRCQNGLVFDPDQQICTWPYGECLVPVGGKIGRIETSGSGKNWSQDSSFCKA